MAVRRGGSGRVASEPRLAPFRRFNQDLICRNTFQKPFHLAYDEYERVKDLQFIKDLFTSADQNGNGTLEYKEFARCMSHPATFRVFNERFGLQRHQTPVVFRAFDLDGSGSISLPEWFETCTFLMQVVKDGDVITNWRQKDMRALKDNWESWNIKYPRQQHRAIAPGSPQGAGSQDRPSGPSTPVTPKRAVAAAERSGSRMCLTAPAALGGRSPLLRHSSSALSAAEDVASPRNACAASAPGGMLDPHGAGGAAKAPGRGGAARGGMLQREPASAARQRGGGAARGGRSFQRRNRYTYHYAALAFAPFLGASWWQAFAATAGLASKFWSGRTLGEVQGVARKPGKGC
ncbi:unnamed protein product [Prorocentrum cordatum]|uniref:EF-hand domain-containing protein n=1 Tax=Prorocentrum cordatum TaxID=2364126 RepID=A0ABN9VC35_9DINO|nr:unnamed protein product [Polarella glacialis]